MLNLITCSEESPPLPNLPITVLQYLKTRQFRLVDTSRVHALRTKGVGTVGSHVGHSE